jgi:hypothetical protein
MCNDSELYRLMERGLIFECQLGFRLSSFLLRWMLPAASAILFIDGGKTLAKLKTDSDFKDVNKYVNIIVMSKMFLRSNS